MCLVLSLPMYCSETHIFFFFKKIFTYFQRGGREREREGEKYQRAVASITPLSGDPARTPSMCSDWESNWRPFVSQACAQSTEPHQPGHIFFLNHLRVNYRRNATLSLNTSVCGFFYKGSRIIFKNQEINTVQFII